MQPNFLATPQKFIIDNTDSVSSFFETVSRNKQQQLNGSVVTSSDAPGSVAYVAACNGRCHKKPSQRLLMTIQSPTKPVMSGTLEFTSTDDPEEEFLGALAGLAMSVIPNLLGANADSAHFTESRSNLVPIIVGPSSAVLAEHGELSEGAMPDSVFGSLLDVAKTVVPVIAPVALDLAQQLFNKRETPQGPMFDFGGIVGDIIKVAAPIAGAALTEIGKRA